ncbi:hypothetical protein COSO111634_20865 [Corallococcus soli]
MRTAPALRCCKRDWKRSTSSTGPETTQRSGALSAASVSRPDSSGWTSDAGSATPSIAPGGSRCISSPRATASRRASGRERTPATHAAAYSPKLWPSTAWGTMPQSCHSRARATCTVKSAGRATRVSASSGAPSTSASGRSRASTRARRGASNSARHASTWTRNAGTDPDSSRPMPSCWLPCPEKTKATRLRRAPSTSFSRTGVAGLQSCLARSAASRATTVRRYSKARRPTACVYATSASADSAPGTESGSANASTAPGARADSTCSASCFATVSNVSGERAVSTCWASFNAAASIASGDRAASTNVASRCAAASRASGERADSTKSWCERDVGPLDTAGASSSTACALVPPTPKELTAARLGVPPRGQGRRWVLTKNGPASKSIRGFGCSKWRLGGISPSRSDSATLMRPASPATVSRWPTFVFSDASGMVPRCSGPRP